MIVHITMIRREYNFKNMTFRNHLKINYPYKHYTTGNCITATGADPEIFHRGWLSGWLHVLYYTELCGVAGKH